MLVGCSPPKWKFLKGHPHKRDLRVKRTKASVIEYDKNAKATQETYIDSAKLQSALASSVDQREQPRVRLIIVEDLSRDIIEVLGSQFDVDPLFWLSHISDYLFNNVRDRWAELPNLDVDARNRSHFNLEYLRPRYFETEKEFDEAEYASGLFNVLRRLDSDRSRKSLQNGPLDSKDASVALSRAKTSLWTDPERKDGSVINAILLVDPTVKEGHAVWGGHRPFTNTPSMKAWKEREVVHQEPRISLFDDVVFLSKSLSKKDLEMVESDPRYIAMSMYRLVLADWLVVLKYMTTMFGIIEWGFHKPHWSEDPSDIDVLLRKLSPWRRNIGYYQKMIDDSIARLFPDISAAYPSTPANLVVPAPSPRGTGIDSLWNDFKNVKHQIEEHKARIVSIQTMATNAINTEEARRAVKQNKNLTRLTVLAAIFIPLNFTSSFLSMSPGFGKMEGSTYTIWIFFAIGVPLTLLAFLIMDMTHQDKEKRRTRKVFRKIFKPRVKQDDPAGSEKLNGVGDSQIWSRSSKKQQRAQATTWAKWVGS